MHYRKTVVGLFLALTVVGLMLWPSVGVNYNMIDYLPADAPSTQALAVMEREFSGSVPNVRVMVRDVSLTEALQYKERLAAVAGVTEVTWLDDVVDIKQPLATIDRELVESYYLDGAALFSLAVAESYELTAVDAFYEIVGDEGAIAGDAASTANYQKLAMWETLKAVALLLPIILLILLLTTSSWLEPLLFLAAIGVAVLLNMGSNLMFGEISFITNSISPVLQLAVSLDYAIFLLHSFNRYRRELGGIEEAMAQAMRRSVRVILASAMTTFFGFIVLIMMDFKIGVDLGIALGKGILLSFIAVTVFLPALTITCYRLIDRTRHRSMVPSFRKASQLIRGLRLPAIILVVLLAVPCYVAQRNNDFNYGTGALDATSRPGQDQQLINDTFGEATPLVVLVPRGDAARESQLAAAFEAIPQVTSVITYVNAIGKEIPSDFLDAEVTSPFYSENYCRFIVYADTPSEGDLAFTVVEEVRALAETYYGDTALSCGLSVNMYDMRTVVTADNALVSLLAIVAIGLVILISFRSLSLPVFLVLTIQTAIWINLAVPYFTGSALNYIGFLVIHTVQLGATVDYAILFSDHYMKNRRRFAKKPALVVTVQETMGSILVSGGILAATGFMVGVVSTNSIVSEFGLLLGRGALLSILMVLFFLPALLTIFDKVIEKTTWRPNFYRDHPPKKEAQNE